MPGTDDGLLPRQAQRSLRRILVPVDAFGRCAGSLAAAAEFAVEMSGELRLVHVRVWNTTGRGHSRFFFETSEEATAILEAALSGVWSRGVRASGVVVDAEWTQVARVIVAEAEGCGAGFIVVARRRRWALSRLLSSSISGQVMRAANCPVLVVRGSGPAIAEVSSNVSR
jgi:nucleotide-binding universal stress UspA family protein